MLVREAKAVARQWVLEKAPTIDSLIGAFSHGSANWLPEDAPLASSSDVDVLLVLADPDPPEKIGKLVYQGALLEVSYLPWSAMQSAAQILRNYRLAGSFAQAEIFFDPAGELARRQAVVACGYAQRSWTLARCEDARQNILRFLDGLRQPAPFHIHVQSWLFAAGVTTHVLLAAGLRNPTVRKRYLAARDLLAEYGQLEFYPSLLTLLGCAEMNAVQVDAHLDALATAFDDAKSLIRTPFDFAQDISEGARPVAIDGSRELIAHGAHREAVFWMVATYSRCMHVFFQDAPAEFQARHAPGYRRLLADLGIVTPSDLDRRSAEVGQFLPQLWELAETIVAANPAVADTGDSERVERL